MDSFNSKPALKLFQQDLAKELEAFCERHNITMSFGSGTYSETDFNAKITFTVKSATIASVNGINLKDSSKKQFEMYASIFGLEPTDFGREFSSDRDRYIITEIAPNRPKYPVTAKRLRDGAGFKFTVADVKHNLAKEAPVIKTVNAQM